VNIKNLILKVNGCLMCEGLTSSTWACVCWSLLLGWAGTGGPPGPPDLWHSNTSEMDQPTHSTKHCHTVL